MNSEQLQQLADRQQITETLYRYCRSVDRLDIELGHSIWNENSVADYGSFYQGDGPGVIDLICKQHSHMLYHTHQISNVIIDVDGDTAGSESYVTAELRVKRGETITQMTVWSRYVDRWSKRQGRWGLDHRIAVRDFDTVREVKPLSSLETEGYRDHQDPSYRVLKNLS
jgi:hypothetical protein